MENTDLGTQQESSELEKPNLMLELVNDLEGYLAKTREYKDFEKERKERLDSAMNPVREIPSTKMLDSVFNNKTRDNSEFKLLFAEVKDDTTPFSIGELRQRIMDSSLPNEQKITILEQTKAWFRVTDQALNQLVPVIGKVAMVVTEEFMELGSSSEALISAKAEFDRYIRQLTDKTLEMDTYIENSHNSWSLKLERAR